MNNQFRRKESKRGGCHFHTRASREFVPGAPQQPIMNKMKGLGGGLLKKVRARCRERAG